MDKRGHTIDPNREVLTLPRWWEKVGPSQKPSPYATASWTYWHDWKTEEEPVFTRDPIEYEFDNGDDFAVWLYPVVYDSGLFNRPTTGALILDEGGFSQTGEPVKYEFRYYGVVKVYDTKASASLPATLEEILIHEDGTAGNVAPVVNPDTLHVFDNSDDVQNPIPNPNVILDSALFTRTSLGEIYDEVQYAIEDNGEQMLVDTNTPQVPDYDGDDFPSGRLLGEVHYEVSGTNMTITDWSHYNWQDATPIKKAVNVLVKEKPTCVEVISVENSPTSLWKSLGFVCPYKGSEMLIHDSTFRQASPY